MSIGLDIKLVLQEIGTPFNIKTPSGEADVTGGYLDYEMNRQVTKPFIREFFLESVFPYDTDVITGDVIELQDGTSRRFLVMNKTVENLEGTGLAHEAVLYMCNVSGELLRPSGEFIFSPQTYQRSTAWEPIQTESYALLTDRLFGTDLLQDDELGQIGIEAQVLYIPHRVGARPLDRYQPTSGEYYKIEVIAERRFPGVDVCYLAEDTR